MASRITQIEAVADRVKSALVQYQNSIDQLRANISGIKAGLSGMAASGDAAVVTTELNAYIVANPNDTLAAAIKSRVDGYVSDFGVSLTEATALEAAIDAVPR